MTAEEVYLKLREDAKEKGSAHGQVWHEADVEGRHLYVADTSFGDGPILHLDKHSWLIYTPFNVPNPYPITRGTAEKDLADALRLAEKAFQKDLWEYRLFKLAPDMSGGKKEGT